ncbi:MAG TPA: V-type ATPase subunit [Gemmatimonadales bacterium]|nr:V-type ATPase subunit [Gemmatimonadales bacterium]
MTRWDDLDARARGLSTRLLGAQVIESLARAPDLAAIAAELQRSGFPIAEPETATAADIELATRRHLAARLATLARWAGPRTTTLAVLFEDEDRRSIGALLRGSVQGAPAAERLAGLIPTPALPERALEELANQPAPANLAALLSAWRHPFARMLAPEATKATPDLATLAGLVDRAFTERALSGAARDGRRGQLYRYVQEVIDLINAFGALVLAAEPDHEKVEGWLAGGRLGPTLLGRAVATRDLGAAGKVLARGFDQAGIATIFSELESNGDQVERRVLHAQIIEWRQAARISPLSAAPLIQYGLRLRAEALDLRRIIWGLRLGTPPNTLAAGVASLP